MEEYECFKLPSSSDDVGDAGNDESDEDDGDYYSAYQTNLEKNGIKINHLGELILPNGAIIGHRALLRMYNQRSASYTSDSDQVAIARSNTMYDSYNLKYSAALSLPKSVKSFTAMSLYRQKFMVKMAKRDNKLAVKVERRKMINRNKLDKKGNRIMNGVSVAHAKR